MKTISDQTKTDYTVERLFERVKQTKTLDSTTILNREYNKIMRSNGGMKN